MNFKNNITATFICVFIITACNNYKEYKFEKAKILFPKKWKVEKLFQKDGSKAFLIINNPDSIIITINDGNDYDFIINTFPKIIDEDMYNSFKILGNEDMLGNVIVIDSLNNSQKMPCVYSDTYFYLDTIDNVPVLFFQPKKNKGFMGLGIEFKGNNDDILLWVKSPSKNTQKELETIFKNIKLK
jgi:hypothetical protein